MEQSESLTKIVGKIKALEEQLSLCASINKECDLSAAKAEEEIEHHFERCMHTLAARKAILLKELAHKVTIQKKNIENVRAKIDATIEACKHTMKAAALMHFIDINVTMDIWKVAQGTPIPHVANVHIITEFPEDIFSFIQGHGKVSGNHCFINVDEATTFAGSNQGHKDGEGVHASLNCPFGICFNPSQDCLYVCESSNNSIRKITTGGGEVSTFVRGGLDTPSSIVANHKDNTLFVTNEGSNTIAKITSSGITSIFAGDGRRSHRDGAGEDASFNCPRGIAIDQATGTLYVCDFGNFVIRKITPQGEVSTLAGSPGLLGSVDGYRRDARFNSPWGICYDHHSQSLLVCESPNSRLRRVLLNGEVSTICEIQFPVAVAVTNNQTILVSTYRHKLYKVTLQRGTCEVTLVAGKGIAGRDDGRRGGEITFHHPWGIAVHEESHSCFVAEFGNHLIRKVSFM